MTLRTCLRNVPSDPPSSDAELTRAFSHIQGHERPFAVIWPMSGFLPRADFAGRLQQVCVVHKSGNRPSSQLAMYLMTSQNMPATATKPKVNTSVRMGWEIRRQWREPISSRRKTWPRGVQCVCLANNLCNEHERSIRRKGFDRIRVSSISASPPQRCRPRGGIHIVGSCWPSPERVRRESKALPLASP